MPEIKLQHVVSFSSEDKVHCAENLLKPETYRKWKCAAGDKQASIILQFEKATKIHSIDIGNENSAFVEVLVGRSTEKSPDYQVLLVASSFMTPGESKSGTNVNRVRMFGSEKLSKTAAEQKWDLVKVVCTQPFNKTIQYGLSFIKFHSAPESNQQEKEEKDLSSPKITKFGSFSLKNEEESTFAPGSLFASKHKTSPPPALKGAAAIRLASTIALSPTSLESPKEGKSPSPKLAPKRKGEVTDDLPKKYPSNMPSYLRPPETTSISNKPQITKNLTTSPRHSLSKQTTASNVPTVKKTSDSQQPKKQTYETYNMLKEVPFSKIMEGIVFVLSGFQNPGRAQLREKALEMGAKYKPDWEDTCTHLICAFANTPKHRQVQKLGGQVVRKEWILECYKKKRKLPWKMFRLDDDSEEEEEDDDDNDQTYEEDDDEEDEDDEEEIRMEKTFGKKHKPNAPKPGTSNIRKISTSKKTILTFRVKKSPKKLKTYDEEENEEISKKYSSEEDSGDDTEDEIRKVREEENKKSTVEHTKSDDDYEGSTDEDVELEKQNVKSLSKTVVENGNSSSTKESIFTLPNLPSFFKEKSFFLFGDFDEATQKLLKRYIIAFGGKFKNYMDQNVSFVITASDWDEQFEQALNENDSLTFVRPQWIFKCKDKGKFVPYQPYVVVPKESSG